MINSHFVPVLVLCLMPGAASCSSDTQSTSLVEQDSGAAEADAAESGEGIDSGFDVSQEEAASLDAEMLEDASDETVEALDGSGDAPAADQIAAGSKTTGQHCSDAAECADQANCVGGQYTPSYCTPNCSTDADCAAAAPGAKGTCQDGGSINFCMFWCGAMFGNAKCPGDLTCDGAACG